jgi:hypothetical protein
MAPYHWTKDPVKIAKYSGENHPTKKNPQVMEALKARMLSNANPMSDPTSVAKISGGNHWTKNPLNLRNCPHCNIQNISKSNYTKYHGDNCKLNPTSVRYLQARASQKV